MTLSELLDELNIPYREYGQHHHVTEDFIGVDCPQCSPGSDKFMLGICKSNWYCSCWQCGYIPLRSALYEITGSYKLKYLLKDVNFSYHKEFKPTGKLKLPYGIEELKPVHKNYLVKRSFSPEKIKKVWNLQGIGVAPHYQWSLFIPIFYKQKMVSWLTRTLKDEGRRYYVSPPECESMNHKEILYGSDMVKHSVIITEGPFDAMKIGPGGVCTFGLSYTRQQVLEAKKYLIRCVCFDNEPVAQNKAKELCKLLEVFPGKTYRIEIDAKDPGSASEKELNLIRKSFL